MNYTTFSNLQKHSFIIDGYYTMTFRPFDMPYHCHDNYELMYIIQGSCSVIILSDDRNKNETVTLFTNQFILINAGQLHRLIVDEQDTKIMNLEIKPVPAATNEFSFATSISSCPSLKALLKKNAPYFKMTDMHNVQETIRLIQNEMGEKDVSMAENHLLQLLLHELFIRISRCINLTTVSGIPYLKSAIKYIEEHYCEPDLNVNRVLQQAAVSQTYLQRLFRQQFGKTVLDYINELRICKAKEMLLKSSESVDVILHTVGFTNRQHFNYTFHKFTDMSPSQFRKDKPMANVRKKDEKSVDILLIDHELKHPNYT